MERILKEAGYAYPVTAIVYKKASHVLGVELSAVARDPAIQRLIAVKMANEKNYPAQCEAARQDCFRQILGTLEAWRQDG